MKLLSRYNPEREKIYLGHKPPKLSESGGMKKVRARLSEFKPFDLMLLYT